MWKWTFPSLKCTGCPQKDFQEANESTWRDWGVGNSYLLEVKTHHPVSPWRLQAQSWNPGTLPNRAACAFLPRNCIIQPSEYPREALCSLGLVWNWILSLRESHYPTSRNPSSTYVENLTCLLLKRVSCPRNMKITRTRHGTNKCTWGSQARQGPNVQRGGHWGVRMGTERRIVLR